MITNFTRALEYRPMQGLILGAVWLMPVAWLERGTIQISGLSTVLFGLALIVSIAASILVSIPESDLNGVLVGTLLGALVIAIEPVIPNEYISHWEIVIRALQFLFGLVVGFVLSMTERALLALAAESLPRIMFGMLIAFICGICSASSFLVPRLIFYWPPD